MRGCEAISLQLEGSNQRHEQLARFIDRYDDLLGRGADASQLHHTVAGQ